MQVVALNRITDDGSESCKLIHAERGERGVLQARNGEWLTVTWDLTGSTCDVHEDELLILSGPPFARA